MEEIRNTKTTTTEWAAPADAGMVERKRIAREILDGDYSRAVQAEKTTETLEFTARFDGMETVEGYLLFATITADGRTVRLAAPRGGRLDAVEGDTVTGTFTVASELRPGYYLGTFAANTAVEPYMTVVR